MPFFSPFVLQMSPSCASFACHYIQFYPYWPFKNPPRRTPRPSKPFGKNSSPYSLLLLYYYRSWAAWTILYSISLQCPPIRIKLIGRVILPRTSWGSAVHTFLVIFQCTFHLLKVRYIIIIPTAVRVCNWQHFLLITIVIIIPINKKINHHNQCITVVSVICPALYSWRCLIR